MRQLSTRRLGSSRLFLHLALVLAMVLVQAFVFMPAASADEPITLTILHTNDTHARIESFTESNVVQGGVARRYTAIQQVRAEGGNVLLVDAGDPFQGTLFFNYWQGLEEAHFMNALGYQAMAIGNHEFDSGPSALSRFIDAANFPVLSANIDASAQVSLTGQIEPYTVITVTGEPVGVFGLTTEDTPFISSPGPDVIFEDAVQTAQQMVAELQGMGINKIVLLSHLGYLPDQALAAAVPGIDVIVGGHSHTPLGSMPGAQGPYPTVVNSAANVPTLIVSAWEWGRYLGRLDVTFNAAGMVTAYQGNPIFINSSIAEDPTIAADVTVWAQPVQALQNTVIGETALLLDGARANVRAKETNLGDLICDAMLWKTSAVGTQVCITNGGGIRASVNPGNVTIGSILTVLPFGNQIATMGLMGSDLIAALENGVSRAGLGDGRFPQVAGMRFSFDPERPAGSRVRSAEIMNADGTYSPVEADEIYQVTTNDFMRRGGDFYTMFATNAIDPYDTWSVMADSVIEYIQAPVSEGGLGGMITADAYPAAGWGRINQVSATVQRSRRYNVSEDTFLNGTQPAANNGNAQTMWVGFNNQLRPVVQVPFPICDNVYTCIPASAQVDQAYLYLYVYEGRGFANWNQSAMLVAAHPVTKMWAEATANWTNPWTTAGGDMDAAGPSVPLTSSRINTWLRLDVTAAVTKIIENGTSNYGFIVTSDPNYPMVNAPEALLSTRFGFTTSEFFDASKAGYIRVYYRTYN
ncbi:MAG: 5'-nucleotidase C-terminal domain-containing protein [Caldilineales bacterium]